MRSSHKEKKREREKSKALVTEFKRRLELWLISDRKSQEIIKGNKTLLESDWHWWTTAVLGGEDSEQPSSFLYYDGLCLNRNMGSSYS